MVLYGDGTWDGFLSVLFAAHALRPMAEEVFICMPAQCDLLKDYRFVGLNEEKAARVLRGIEEKLPSEALDTIQLVFASRLPEAGNLIYNYLLAGWRLGKRLNEHLTHPAVLPVQTLCRKVGHEVHRMSGLARFASTQHGVFYSKIQPDYDIVPMLAPHFVDRFGDQHFVLHDIGHGTAAIYDLEALHIVRLEPGQAPSIAEDASQDVFATLWKSFYEAIAIKERISEKRRRGHVPVRYWKHMTELSEKTFLGAKSASPSLDVARTQRVQTLHHD